MSVLDTGGCWPLPEEATASAISRLEAGYAASCAAADGDPDVGAFEEALNDALQANKDAEDVCTAVLERASFLLEDSSNSQVIWDRAVWEIMHIVARSFGASKERHAASSRLFIAAAEACDPREMFTCFLDVLSSAQPENRVDDTEPWGLQLATLNALVTGKTPAVFRRLPRRHATFLSEAVPIILQTLKSVTRSRNKPELDEDVIFDIASPYSPGTLSARSEAREQNLFRQQMAPAAVRLCQTVCCIFQTAQDGPSHYELRQEIFLFALQLLALSRVTSFMPHLSRAATGTDMNLSLLSILCQCKVSLSELLRPELLVPHRSNAHEEDEDEQLDLQAKLCMDITLGAGMAAYWIICHNEEIVACTNYSTSTEGNEVGQAEQAGSDEDMLDRHSVIQWLVKEGNLLELSREQAEDVIVLAGVMLRQSQEVALHAADLMEAAISVIHSRHGSQSAEDIQQQFPEKLTDTLQVLQLRMVLSSSAALAKRCFEVLQEVLLVMYTSRERFKAVRSLIVQAPHPMMVSLLLRFAKEEADKCLQVRLLVPGTSMTPNTPDTSSREEQSDSVAAPGQGATCTASEGHDKQNDSSPFATADILILIKHVLCPPSGRPLDLTAECDSVMAALNLYRFLLLRESAAGSNRTGIRSGAQLERSRREWLLPLRQALVAAAAEEAAEEAGGAGVALGLLLRCLELNEQAQAQARAAAASVQ
eukprot:SM000011S19142  [mRNA]  locus=s11:1171346:1176157:+ [translate_table: standard]